MEGVGVSKKKGGTWDFYKKKTTARAEKKRKTRKNEKRKLSKKKKKSSKRKRRKTNSKPKHPKGGGQVSWGVEEGITLRVVVGKGGPTRKGGNTCVGKTESSSKRGES